MRGTVAGAHRPPRTEVTPAADVDPPQVGDVAVSERSSFRHIADTESIILQPPKHPALTRPGGMPQLDAPQVDQEFSYRRPAKWA